MINESIVCLMRGVADRLTPWLVGAVAGFFLLWLVLLVRDKNPFANELKRFWGLEPLHKFIVVCALCFFALWGGSKERGILPFGLIDGTTSAMKRGGETIQTRFLPGDISTNALAVTGFAVDAPNQTVMMEVTCATNLFDYTDSRYLDIFMSTNLTDDYYFWIKDFPIPAGTNSCVVSISESAGDTESQTAFANAFGDKAFFIVAADIDSDGDGLTDTYETRTSFTNPIKADTDGDGIPDGRELRPWVGTNPFLYDTDGDGVGDGDEIAAGSDPMVCDSDGDGMSDAYELGSMAACVGGDFMWFDMSGGTDLLSGYSTADNDSWTIPLSSGTVVNGVCYTNVRVCVDGTVYLLCPTNNASCDYCNYSDSLSNSQWSATHLAIALCGSDLYARTSDWGSRISHGSAESEGRTFDVIEYRNIGHWYYYEANELVTCQVILPHDETNVVYVSYLSASNAFRTVDLTVGIQCGWMGSRKAGERFYSLSWPITADFPPDGLTIKYSIGTFTDPTKADTDGDGLDDRAELTVHGTDPLNPDTDGDDLCDGEEIAAGTDPQVPDTDGDGLQDGAEIAFGSDPLASDTDGDGVGDFIERLAGSDPTTSRSDADVWTDVEELGYVAELPQEEFMWFDLSGGENLLGNTSVINSQSWPITMGGDFAVNELCYTNARVCLDGMVYLLNPTNASSFSYSDGCNYSGGFSNSYFSSTHTALSGYNANMYAKSAWGSALLHGTVTTNGHAYKVVEYRNIGHYDYRNTNDVLLTYQLIFPMHETNVFYVSYLRGDRLFETFNPLVGMQCPTVKSAVYTNQNYSLSWEIHSGALDTPLTLKFTIGTGTHPAKTDTDGDGLSDSDEILLYRTNPRNPDCDGDGLPDGAEVAAGTDPYSGDSDSDGIPDGWEVRNGLDPHSDDSLADNDSDGLSNIYECRNSTNPSDADSDGDGLPDIIEAAWLSTSECIPWFDMSGATVMSPDSNVDAALYACDIPFPAKILAFPVSVVVADVNGVVYFGNSDTTNGLWSTYGERDMADNMDLSSIAVAPYWTDLYLRTTLDSEISHKTVVFDGQNYLVLQYKRVGTGSGSTNEVSFQISIPESSPSNVVYVRYGTLIDARGNGNKVTVGAQGFANLAKLPVSCAMPSHTAVTNGMVVAYHFGCGSDPAVKDTDGDGVRDDVELLQGSNPRNPDTDDDGMTDEWEIRHGLDPCSSEGVNGPAGDPDGDGVDNINEYSTGTNPYAADSDNDGLSDGEEAVCVSSVSPLPWLEFVTITNLTDVIADSWGCVTIGLPSPIIVQQETVTNITVGMDGVVLFNRGGYLNPEWIDMPYDFESGIADANCFTIAPYWNYGLYMSDEAAPSSISFGTAAVDTNGYYVLQFLNLYQDLDDYETNSISFQVAFPTGHVDRIHVRYADVVGDEMDGRNALIGCQSFNAKENVTYCRSEQGMVYDGMGLCFVVGYGSDPTNPDTDGDGLADNVEVNAHGSDPRSEDTDGDGLSDFEEIACGTSVRDRDSDGDGLLDGWEVANGFNPLSQPGQGDADGDVDGDGLANLDEQSHGSDPRNGDTDNDGLSDSMEITRGTDILFGDTDHDGLLDGLEVSFGTDPLQPDSDSDGMNDGWEYRYRDVGFDPRVDNARDRNPDNDIDADPDGDKLTNGKECEWGTNPVNADTDGDGVNDGSETRQNSDPTDVNDEGKPDSRVPITFHFGDPSSSHSEKYRLEVTPVSGHGETPASFSWLNEDYGESETKNAMLRPGWKYEVRLYHAGTDPDYDGTPHPDYDYELSCNSGSLPKNVVVDDPEGLFDGCDDGEVFTAAGKVATIAVCTVTCVKICKPEDPSWAELEASRVVLDDENLRIKVEIAPQISSLAQCRQAFGNSLIVKTSGTCPGGASMPISDDATIVNLSDKSEIRISKTRQQLISLGLLPSQNEDGVNEMAWLDMGSPNPSQTSNLTDSEAFSALGYQFRGKATVDSTKTLESTPPNSIPSESFFKAAGCEIVSATYGGTSSRNRQIMNQSDYLYYSGHGLHLYKTIDPGFGPETVNGYWNKELKCVIFSACSILDINDYNNNFQWEPEEHNLSPGKAWEAVGPSILLGYNYYAPADNTGVPAQIISSWMQSRSSTSDIEAWMSVNRARKQWNACAIQKGIKYVYFENLPFGIHIKREVNKEDW